MSEYIITSGSYTVTKDGTPIAGSPFSSDQAALQAAHDDAADNDVLTMRQSNASTKFTFQTAEQLLISKAITLQGQGADRTSITGGTRAILFNGVGKKATFKDFTLEDGTEAGMQIKNATDVLIDGVHVTVDTSKDREGALSADAFVGIAIGMVATLEEMDAYITGNIEIRDVECDLEAAMNPADPYAGDLNKINPAKVSEGGNWPDAGGENPDAWSSIGIVAGQVPANKKLLIRDCVVRNYSYYGIIAPENLGQVEISNCEFDSWYGVHEGGSSGGSYGALFMNGSPRYIDANAAYGLPHGYWNLFDCQVTLRGKRMGGFLAYVPKVPGRPLGCRIANNIVDAKLLASYGISFMGVDYAQIVHNVFKGPGSTGILCGTPAPSAYVPMTRFCTIVGNDFSEWTPYYKNIWFTSFTEGCLASPAPHASLNYYLDQGVGNIIWDRL